uniref:Ragweed homologue of Art v 1 n=1 Tax=Ambrosia artemisiifolia TaxID=4212 RepID=D4IIH0_AMBAR|nr:ragweed homologue of Art v 1 precursor [Ambrosia artemisiifolia]
MAAGLLVFVLAISEIASVKGKLCEKPSLTWSGKCKVKQTDKCDKRCIEWEGAKHGACHKRDSKATCFCYFDCDPTKNPGPPPGAPKGKAPAPSPPSGGGAPPPSGGEGGER